MTVDALYRVMTTQSLLDLQAAFRVDRRGLLHEPEALRFVDQRLRLIALELAARGDATPDPGPGPDAKEGA